MKTILRVITSICVLLVSSFASHAELRKLELIEDESPYFDGRSFGAVGQYEIITARPTIAVDPRHRLNAGIVEETEETGSGNGVRGSGNGVRVPF